MRFTKSSASGLEIVECREWNVDMTNMACLGSDLMKEWDDVGAIRDRRCGAGHVKKLEAIIEI